MISVRRDMFLMSTAPRVSKQHLNEMMPIPQKLQGFPDTSEGTGGEQEICEKEKMRLSRRPNKQNRPGADFGR